MFALLKKLEHDLPTLFNSKVNLSFRKGFIFFIKTKKISEFTVYNNLILKKISSIPSTSHYFIYLVIGEQTLTLVHTSYSTNNVIY